MTPPVLVGLRYEGEQPKMFFRAMLFGASSRGRKQELTGGIVAAISLLGDRLIAHCVAVDSAVRASVIVADVAAGIAGAVGPIAAPLRADLMPGHP